MHRLVSLGAVTATDTLTSLRVRVWARSRKGTSSRGSGRKRRRASSPSGCASRTTRTTSTSSVTHEIDPNVDEARDYVAQDLILSQHVEALGLVSGVGAATREEPRRNYTLSPSFTDGLRAVILISDDATPLDEIDFFEWH
jgi:hypothetical protein